MKLLRFAIFVAWSVLMAEGAWAQTAVIEKSPDSRYAIGSLKYADDFSGGLGNWVNELENGGNVRAQDGGLDINVPAGCCVWFKPLLHGPLMIEYNATVVKGGVVNERVSDLNCFWMARDPRSADDFFAHPRSGKFTDYDQLLTYYVGLGGNTNTTTRFRRYIGQQDNRPLLPQNDLRDKPNLIVANESLTLRLIACGSVIQFWRDDKKIFELNDPAPYTDGWFALRTTKNHMLVKNFRVFELKPILPATTQSAP